MVMSDHDLWHPFRGGAVANGLTGVKMCW